MQFRDHKIGKFGVILVSIAVPYLAACSENSLPSVENWTDREVRILTTFRIPVDLPVDRSNKYADDPTAAQFGKLLFFDKRLSGNEKVACAGCHQPALFYSDGLPKSVGTGKAMRNAPTVVGTAFNTWFYWDGRRDSLWSQALIPFEAADEMGGSRVSVVRAVALDEQYRSLYESIFDQLPASASAIQHGLPEQAGPFGSTETRDNWYRLPVATQREINSAYANIGKAIAAFERTLRPPITRLDKQIASLGAAPTTAEFELTEDEIGGAKLFMNSDKTQCLQCHNGAMLTNGDFHNIGTGNFQGEMLDYGRVFGLRAVLMDEFNCLGPYSDAESTECSALRFLNKDSHVPLDGAFKVPTLRGLKYTSPYFHDGRFSSLREVLGYYNNPPSSDVVGPHELRPLNLTAGELGQLEAFLLTLSH